MNKEVWMNGESGPVSVELDELTIKKVEKAFTYHPPKEGQAEKYEALRSIFKNAAYNIERLCPNSREKSLAITHLEDTMMWAIASIARNE
jgi:hypothetical protein